LDRADLRARLRASFTWLGDRTDEHRYAEVTAWWRDPGLLSEIGSSLADLFRGRGTTVVMGVEARGFVLGPLVAVGLGAGFVEVRKEPSAASDSDRWIRCATPPDYRDRNLTLGVRRDLITSADQVLLVDDWIDTGGQALGVRRIVDEVDANWVGAAVVVDALESHAVRRQLAVRSLLHLRELR
jgi:adenine phosphoribosyltransferase